MADLRTVRDTDLADVLSLNEANVVQLAPMDEARLQELRATADRFDVVDVDGAFAGFVVTFTSDADYDSDNFSWFTARHPQGGFYYLDRIALDPAYRRRGLGGFVYDEMERVAAPHSRLALEVNVVPPNEPSLAFHTGRGYAEVGRRGDAAHTVAMMEKSL